MDNAPRIGDRVQVKIRHRYYPCKGVVTAIFPVRRYDVTDPRWDEEGYDPPDLGVVHERDWLVSVQVDSIPENWEYFDSDIFQPKVFELEPA